MTGAVSTPWLKNKNFDLAFIIGPSFFSVLIVFLFYDQFVGATNVPLWAWIVFILCIDVAHVYSTLFRTYFNAIELKENRLILTLIPIGVWLIGVMLYSMGALVFWRFLAYVAVFHFIRQQYGFMRLYGRAESVKKWEHRLDAALIYLATLYPLMYWHSEPREFHWFIEGDFFSNFPAFVPQVFGVVYSGIAILYAFKEIYFAKLGRPFNLPKNLLIVGTALSWWVGIVLFNGDLVFTVTNVVSHGIPYLALVWLYGERQAQRDPMLALNYKLFFSRFSLPLFLGLLILLAYLEEGLWHGLVWRENLSAFGLFSYLPAISAKDSLSWLVPLLTLPQATHYVLDGFIWKMKDKSANWQKNIFLSRPTK